MTNENSKPTIALVHGGFVDGSGWEGVYNILRRDNYNVSIVQNPTTSLADDVAATKSVISAAGGPVVLVGHSYGGVVITEAGNDPQVAALVYIAAFAPDMGESVSALIKDPPPAQRFMSQRAGATVVEVPGSHSVYVSRPDAVAALIEQAAAHVSQPALSNQTVGS